MMFSSVSLDAPCPAPGVRTEITARFSIQEGFLGGKDELFALLTKALEYVSDNVRPIKHSSHYDGHSLHYYMISALF